MEMLVFPSCLEAECCVEEDVECQMDKWLPSLEHASVWNNWTEEDKLLQLVGHLQG